jgi:hypothetical protein
MTRAKIAQSTCIWFRAPKNASYRRAASAAITVPGRNVDLSGSTLSNVFCRPWLHLLDDEITSIVVESDRPILWSLRIKDPADSS